MVTQVTNAAALPQADLAVAMTGPASAGFLQRLDGLWRQRYEPGAGHRARCFPDQHAAHRCGITKASRQPARLRTIQGSNVIFNLGTLTNGAFRNFQLTVQPTNAGTLPFVSVVSTNGVIDPNLANNLGQHQCRRVQFPVPSGSTDGDDCFHAKVQPIERAAGTEHCPVECGADLGGFSPGHRDGTDQLVVQCDGHQQWQSVCDLCVRSHEWPRRRVSVAAILSQSKSISVYQLAIAGGWRDPCPIWLPRRAGSCRPIFC